MFDPQTLEGGEQVHESHVDRARDHTRGLLEVTASIAVSTAHALHDVAVMLSEGHADHLKRWVVTSSTTGLGTA